VDKIVQNFIAIPYCLILNLHLQQHLVRPSYPEKKKIFFLKRNKRSNSVIKLLSAGDKIVQNFIAIPHCLILLSLHLQQHLVRPSYPEKKKIFFLKRNKRSNSVIKLLSAGDKIVQNFIAIPYCLILLSLHLQQHLVRPSYPEKKSIYFKTK